MSDFPLSETLAGAAPIVEKALRIFAPTIRRRATAIGKDFIDSAIVSLQVGFAPYLRTSYERCRQVKTLLTQDRPLPLLDIYVHLFLDCSGECVSDDSLIENLGKYGRVVVTGLAGCGKSMYLKYLTICRFENGRGTIPVFVELTRAKFADFKRSSFLCTSSVRMYRQEREL